MRPIEADGLLGGAVIKLVGGPCEGVVRDFGLPPVGERFVIALSEHAVLYEVVDESTAEYVPFRDRDWDDGDSDADSRDDDDACGDEGVRPVAYRPSRRLRAEGYGPVETHYNHWRWIRE